jgi:hypothetical protein
VGKIREDEMAKRGRINGRPVLLENASETGSKLYQKRVDKEHTLDFVVCSAGIAALRRLRRCNASGSGCQAAIIASNRLLAFALRHTVHAL